MNGTVNKQNCRIYATENPQDIQEVPLHDEKVTLEELQDNIREEIAAIPAEMLANTMENAAKRAQNAINARGGHLRDIIFKN